MSDLVERLRRVGEERQRTTAHDDPTHYLHVVAKISNADGLLMLEAADDIDRLTEGRDMMGNRWARGKERADALEARVKELEAASSRVLEWAGPIAGDNRNGTEAEEEVASVEALRAALSQPAQEEPND
jgi:hypothetical protein